MSLILAGTVRFPADRLEEARAAIVEVMRHSRAEEGCGAFDFSEDLTEPGLFHVFELWRDEAALKEHYQTPHFLTFRARREEIGMTERRLTAYTVASSKTI